MYSLVLAKKEYFKTTSGKFIKFRSHKDKYGDTYTFSQNRIIKEDNENYYIYNN